LKKESQLKNPTGYGSSNGLSFVLNSYEPAMSAGRSKNWMLSITNENDNYDFYSDNFSIEPGFIHTFKVVASQMATSENFDQMSPGKKVARASWE
jgi:hypothetical protein